MGKKQSHPELGHEGQQSLYSFQLKSQKQLLREKLFWIITGLGLGITVAVGVGFFMPLTDVLRTHLQAYTSPSNTPLKQGLEQGMRAAELTQSAELREDWVEVAMLWQNAIALLQSVIPSSQDYATAQQKITEYERNLEYAERNVATRPARQPLAQDYWTLGSDRELVLSIQGTPSQVRQVSTSCYETLHYANSIVELQNGYVSSYDNFDNNLKVLGVGETALSIRSDAHHWTIGSSKATVVQLQGTPNRTNELQSEQYTTLYYGDSFVLVEEGRVVGYFNGDNNLKVSMVPDLPRAGDAPPWSLGSTRLQVLQGQQQTPQAISRSDESCEEIFHFGLSEVHFRQGIVTGYRNIDQNLNLP